MTLDQRQIRELFRDLESERVERKRSASDGNMIRRTICAFANDLPGHGQPGVIFIGVDDNGSCAQASITDELLRTLADMRDDGNIQPLPGLSVQRHVIDGCDVAVVIVQPSATPPVRYRGRTWVRVGPRMATASLEEERRLNERRRFRDLPYDLHALHSATLDDLELDLFTREYLPKAVAPDLLGQNERSLSEQLSSVRFLALDPGIHPTVVGMLTIGKSPADYIPGGYVQFLRISGVRLDDPIADQKEVHGPLPQLLNRLDDLVDANIDVAVDVESGPVERAVPDYPKVALQQLIRNGVMHRNYETSHAPTRITWFDDRIEIQNPGGPFGQVTIENFGTPGVTDYRNPHVAEAMGTLGYVQRFGLGIQLARQRLDDNGNPPLEFEVEQACVLARVWKRR